MVAPWLIAFPVWILVCIGLLATGPSSRGQSPAFATSQSLKVFAGERVEIRLATLPIRNKTRFLIRSQPRHGKIGEIRPNPDGTALLTYTVGSDSQASDDAFTYAAQHFGGTVSAAEKVTIQILRHPAKLKSELVLDFGEVEVGATEKKTLRVRNSGGESYLGRASAGGQWSLLPACNQLTVEPGKSVDVEVSFLPPEPFSYDAMLTFENQPEAAVRLTGVGRAVFEIGPKAISLVKKGSSLGLRSGSFIVKNVSARSRKFCFEVPDFLFPIPDLKIPSGQTKEVAVRARENIPGAGAGHILASTDGKSKGISISSPALPALLLVKPAGPLTFDLSLNQQPLPVNLAIENSGGSPTTVRVISVSNIIAEPSTFQLPAGESRRVVISLKDAPPSSSRSRLLLEYEGGRSEIDVLISGRPRNLNTPNPAVVVAEPEFRKDRQLPQEPALVIKEVDQKNGFIILHWYDPVPDRKSYHIATQRIVSSAMLVRENLVKQLSADSESLRHPEKMLEYRKRYDEALKVSRVFSEWKPIKDVVITPLGGGMHQASFPIPPDSQRLTVKITPCDKNGKPAVARTVIKIPIDARLHKKPLHWSLVLGISLLAGIGLIFAIRFIRKRFF